MLAYTSTLLDFFQIVGLCTCVFICQVQYEFVYTAVSQGLNFEDAAISCANFRFKYPELSKRDPHSKKTMIEKQYEVLQRYWELIVTRMFYLL